MEQVNNGPYEGQVSYPEEHQKNVEVYNDALKIAATQPDPYAVPDEKVLTARDIEQMYEFTLEDRVEDFLKRRTPLVWKLFYGRQDAKMKTLAEQVFDADPDSDSLSVLDPRVLKAYLRERTRLSKAEGGSEVISQLQVVRTPERRFRFIRMTPQMLRDKIDTAVAKGIGDVSVS